MTWLILTEGISRDPEIHHSASIDHYSDAGISAADDVYRILDIAMILLPLPPSNNRYYRHFRGMTVLSKEGKEFKKEVALRCRAEGLKPFSGDVELYAILHPRQKKDGSASKVRVDLDAILKAVCDSLNGIWYEDDKQITRIIAEVGEPVRGGATSVQVEPRR